MKMKLRSIYKVNGKHVTKLADGDWNEIPVDVQAPGKDKLTTFDIGPWLVLYPYGDDSMPPSVRERIFGKVKQQAVAVHRETGQIGFAGYYTDYEDGTKTHGIMVHGWPPDFYPGMPLFCLPAKYVERLDELRSKKRPYRTHLDPGALQNFIDREIGYGDLIFELVIAFRFDGVTVEITQVGDGICYREVSTWEPCRPEDDEGEE